MIDTGHAILLSIIEEAAKIEREILLPITNEIAETWEALFPPEIARAKVDFKFWWNNQSEATRKTLIDNVRMLLGGIIGAEATNSLFNLQEHIMKMLEQKQNKLNEISQMTRPIQRDPLVLDLNGDGFRPTTTTQGAHFDLDQNRFAERIGWIQGDDALLTIDKNGDGKINDGSEIFGDVTRLKNGELARNGFEALREYDSNHDGLITAEDADFSRLMVWRDANGNGISEAGELVSLSEVGVVAIHLNYQRRDTETPSGTRIGHDFLTASACSW